MQAFQLVGGDDVHLLLALAAGHRGPRTHVRIRQVSQHAHARGLGGRAGKAAQHTDLLANQLGRFLGCALRADLEDQLRPGVSDHHLVELVADGLEVRNRLHSRHEEHMGRSGLFGDSAPVLVQVRARLIAKGHKGWPGAILLRQLLEPGDCGPKIGNHHAPEVARGGVFAHGGECAIDDLVAPDRLVQVHLRIVGVHDLAELASAKGIEAPADAAKDILELFHVDATGRILWGGLHAKLVQKERELLEFG